HGHVHHLADLLREDLAQRAAEDGEVLGEEEDLAAEDGAVAGDDRVTVRAIIGHPELDLAVTDIAVELDERAGVAELLGALAGEEATFLAALRDGLLAARVERLAAQLLEPRELARRRVV